ncbi:MAG TPA: acyl-ACP--UDP-N-acetylglucosamine O-acyltransferase [Thermoanaerobaculia bacterium]
MTAAVHPTAIVASSARLGDGVSIGPYAMIGDEVVLGPGTSVGAYASIQGPTVLGSENRVFPHAVLGFDPQDLKYRGEPSRLVVGARNIFREFCTIHRGTAATGETVIGDENFFLAYTHVAHDCHIGSRCIFSNNASLGGHIEVGDGVVLSAFVGAHQFTRIGAYAFVGAFTPIRQDILPFCKTDGNDAKTYGLNKIGLERHGFSKDRVGILDKAYRILIRSKLNTKQAVDRLEGELSGHPDVRYLIDFVTSAKRGFHR